jgi:uncharacterized protein YjiS (DUF1127 family)
MFLSALLASIHRWRLYRDTVHELPCLSDRALDELDIDRRDIAAVARRGLPGSA